jgi:hypothetical protein
MVRALTAEMIVDAEMVTANWRKNHPEMPLMNAHGTNTAQSTRVMAMIGPLISAMAWIVAASVDDADKAVHIVLAQFKAGQVDLTRVTQLEQTLVQTQDLLTQAQQEVATGLIQVYRALGGGWEIRLTDCEPGPLPPSSLGERSMQPAPSPNPATSTGPVSSSR